MHMEDTVTPLPYAMTLDGTEIHSYEQRVSHINTRHANLVPAFNKRCGTRS
jgi:hypothetical protein